ncbi:MAG: glycosyltransferase family 2 protein [Anaerostipes sp.]|jgi:glycosyltransferase involved in cell wall biosynthesis|nr:glycosyltransferase [Anaerostipes sp.]
MQAKKISVIVPAYNAEKYIKDCIESLLCQTYSNLEIIIVDDGSKDNTGSIIDEFAVKDRRIVAVHIDNGGVTNARNVGLKKATGDYVGFCDADDTTELDMYQFLMDLIHKYKVELAHCGYNHITKGIVQPVKGTKETHVQDRDTALKYLLSGGLFTGSLCNKIYKKELFDGIEINKDIKINEDILMNFFIMKKIQKSVFVDVCKYNYITREETGACLNTNYVEKAKQGLKVNQLIYRELQKESKELRQIGYEKVIMSYIDLYRCILFDKKVKKRKEKLSQISKHLWQKLKSKGVGNRKNKITIYLLHYIPFLYPIMFQVYDKIRQKNIDV